MTVREYYLLLLENANRTIQLSLEQHTRMVELQSGNIQKLTDKLQELEGTE